MTINPDAARHDERTTREPTELRPPEEFAHLRWHWVRCMASADTSLMPVLWQAHDNCWAVFGDGERIPTKLAALFGWRYHAPCDPDAVTLSVDNAVQGEAAARAICLESEGSEDRWFDYEPEAKSAIRALKEMKP